MSKPRRNTARQLGIRVGDNFAFYGLGTQPWENGCPAQIVSYDRGFFMVVYVEWKPGATEGIERRQSFSNARKFWAKSS